MILYVSAKNSSNFVLIMENCSDQYFENFKKIDISDIDKESSICVNKLNNAQYLLFSNSVENVNRKEYISLEQNDISTESSAVPKISHYSARKQSFNSSSKQNDAHLAKNTKLEISSSNNITLVRPGDTSFLKDQCEEQNNFDTSLCENQKTIHQTQEAKLELSVYSCNDNIYPKKICTENLCEDEKNFNKNLLVLYRSDQLMPKTDFELPIPSCDEEINKPCIVKNFEDYNEKLNPNLPEEDCILNCTVIYSENNALVNQDHFIIQDNRQENFVYHEKTLNDFKCATDPSPNNELKKLSSDITEYFDSDVNSLNDDDISYSPLQLTSSMDGYNFYGNTKDIDYISTENYDNFDENKKYDISPSNKDIVHTCYDINSVLADMDKQKSENQLELLSSNVICNCTKVDIYSITSMQSEKNEISSLIEECCPQGINLVNFCTKNKNAINNNNTKLQILPDNSLNANTDLSTKSLCPNSKLPEKCELNFMSNYVSEMIVKESLSISSAIKKPNFITAVESFTFSEDSAILLTKNSQLFDVQNSATKVSKISDNVKYVYSSQFDKTNASMKQNLFVDAFIPNIVNNDKSLSALSCGSHTDKLDSNLKETSCCLSRSLNEISSNTIYKVIPEAEHKVDILCAQKNEPVAFFDANTYSVISEIIINLLNLVFLDELSNNINSDKNTEVHILKQNTSSVMLSNLNVNELLNINHVDKSSELCCIKNEMSSIQPNNTHVDESVKCDVFQRHIEENNCNEYRNGSFVSEIEDLIKEEYIENNFVNSIREELTSKEYTEDSYNNDISEESKKKEFTEGSYVHDFREESAINTNVIGLSKIQCYNYTDRSVSNLPTALLNIATNNTTSVSKIGQSKIVEEINKYDNMEIYETNLNEKNVLDKVPDLYVNSTSLHEFKISCESCPITTQKINNRKRSYSSYNDLCTPIENKKHNESSEFSDSQIVPNFESKIISSCLNDVEGN